MPRPPRDLFDAMAGLDEAREQLLAQAADKMRLSALGLHRILRLSRTIVDLAGSEIIGRVHVAKVLSYRQRLSMS